MRNDMVSHSEKMITKTPVKGKSHSRSPLNINFQLKNIGNLVKNTHEFLSNQESQDFNVISAQRARQLDADETYNFFRRFERNQNNTWILQYLISFLNKIPTTKDIDNDIANPFEQFKEFIVYNIKLLIQKDVILSILDSLRQQGILQDNNIAECRVWIYKKYKEMLSVLEQAKNPVVQDWKKTLLSLKMWCLFWFSLHQYNSQRIRHFDLYIYQLVTILLKKMERSII